MKNIHLIPTDQPSRLYSWENKLELGRLSTTPMNRNIYITSDEEIGTDEYYFHLKNNEYYNSGRIDEVDKDMKFWRKIILTTDQDLTKVGVQAIDDEFLEWFVKNPSCEEVEVEEFEPIYGHQNNSNSVLYKIIIPSVEPKQETLEEVVNNFKKTDVYINEIKQEQERSYSEEDMKKCWDASKRFERPISEGYAPNFNEFIEQFKKKKYEK
jgi:hypothetical protein